MLKVNISNASKNLSWGGQFETELEAQQWLSKQIGKPNRLPERQVPKYDEKGEPALDENGEQIIEIVPAEFVVEIVDLSKDFEYTKKEIQEKRKNEYPDLYEVVEALLEELEGRPEKITELMMKRNEIKDKYPLPVKTKKD
jgi:hypothetical protein